jgi:hypothetical protein
MGKGNSILNALRRHYLVVTDAKLVIKLHQKIVLE